MERPGSGPPGGARRPSRAATDVNPSPKKPNHIDRHVAKRLRLRRALVGISQEELARRLGLTSQQIQKYEAGETRVSASRLYDMARQLAVPIAWFFDELDEAEATPDAVTSGLDPALLNELMGRREVRQLIELYFGIADERLRKKVIEVAGVLRDTGGK